MVFHLYPVLSTIVLGFQYLWLLTCIPTIKISGFHTNRSTFAGDRAVMASKTHVLASRLLIHSVFCDFLIFYVK